MWLCTTFTVKYGLLLFGGLDCDLADAIDNVGEQIACYKRRSLYESTSRAPWILG